MVVSALDISFGIRAGTGLNLKFDMFLIISRFGSKLSLREGMICIKGCEGTCLSLSIVQSCDPYPIA